MDRDGFWVCFWFAMYGVVFVGVVDIAVAFSKWASS